MYKNPLTKGQRADNYAESICIELIKGLKRRRGELDMQHDDFAELIGVGVNTWARWRSLTDSKKKKSTKAPDVNKVLRAAYLANVKINLEVVS